jgi:hypothetical protein
MTGALARAPPALARRCNDDDTDSTFCRTRSWPDDPSPWLSVTYPCATSLSSVLVWSKQDDAGKLVQAYALQVWARGQLLSEQPFVGSLPSYSFQLAPGERRSWALPLPWRQKGPATARMMAGMDLVP